MSTTAAALRELAAAQPDAESAAHLRGLADTAEQEARDAWPGLATALRLVPARFWLALAVGLLAWLGIPTDAIDPCGVAP